MSTIGTERTHTWIRWIIRQDMPRILEIERSCYFDAWSEEEFLNALRKSNTIGMAIEFRGVIAGYMLYELNRRTVKLINLAVDPSFRRIGIGTQLIDKLKSKLYGHREMIDATVPERNVDAQLFFRSQGFRCVHTMKDMFTNGDDGYYFIHWKDGDCYGA